MIVLTNSLLKVVTMDHAILTRDRDVLRVRDAGMRSGVVGREVSCSLARLNPGFISNFELFFIMIFFALIFIF